MVVMSGIYFPWQEENTFLATLHHGPQGEGDNFHMTAFDGTPFQLNGNSSLYVGMYDVAK